MQDDDFDLVIMVPELDAYGMDALDLRDAELSVRHARARTLPDRNTNAPRAAAGARHTPSPPSPPIAPPASQDLASTVPVLRIGSVLFHGQHQHALGTVALLSPSCPHPRNGAGAGAGGAAGGAPACCRARAQDANAAAEGRPPLAALTRRTLVFKCVSGDVGELLRSGATKAAPPRGARAAAT